MSNRLHKFYREAQSELSGQQHVRLSGQAHLHQESDSIVIRFKKKNVVTILSDGTHILDTGGWRTPAVRSTIEAAIKKLGLCIVQQAGIWFISHIDPDQPDRYLFADGVKIRADGRMVGARLEEVCLKVDPKMINRYVSTYVREWKKGQVTSPSPVDPYNFYLMVTNEKAVPNLPELRQHLAVYMQAEYLYCFGSLLLVAINDVGGSETEKLELTGKLHIQEWMNAGKPRRSKFLDESGPQVGEILRQYLRKLFGIKEKGVSVGSPG